MRIKFKQERLPCSLSWSRESKKVEQMCGRYGNVYALVLCLVFKLQKLQHELEETLAPAQATVTELETTPTSQNQVCMCVEDVYIMIMGNENWGSPCP